ncbi:MAG: DMT family transporter [Notoacmeibacter sp.]|nr:DMT family transporter [Notoacmeibacter sp.]
MTAVDKPVRSHTTTGIAMMSAGVACLCVNDALAKALASGYPAVQILFLRNAIALPVAILIAWRMGGATALSTSRPWTHLLRGLIWLAAATLFFTGLGMLGLAEATALVFIAPIFVTAISALVLADPVGWRRWSAVIAGFAGVLIVVRPGMATFQPASLFPLGTAFFYALLMVSARYVDPRESVWTLMVWLVGAGGLLSALIAPFIWVPVEPSDVWLFLAIALFGTAGMTLMTQAFRFAPASVIAPFDYTALVWATLIGWLVWHEIPDAMTFVGAAVIVASGLYIVWREARAEP